LPSKLTDRWGMIISPAAFSNGADPNLKPVGAGPWKVSEFVKGDHLTVTRFDDYYAPEAVKLASLTIKLMKDDDARLNALRSGDIDIARLLPTQVTLAKADPTLTIQTDPSLGVDHIGLNISIKPFDNEKVRAAMNLAIDREAFVAGLYNNVGVVAYQPFPPGYYANDPSLEGKLKVDLTKAKQLLAEAGYPDGFTFDFYTNSEPSRQKATQAVADMLSKIGIKSNIVPLDGTTLLNDFYYNNKVAAYFTPWGGRADPSMTLDNLFGPTGLNNPSHQTDPAVKALLDQASAEMDQAKRGPIFQQTAEALMKINRFLPIDFPGVTTGFRSNVVGYKTGLVGYANFLNVGVTAK